MSESEGYQTMSDEELIAYDRWLQEKSQKRRRAHIIEEEMRRHEEEQRNDREISARTSSGSESSSEETPATSKEQKSTKAETTPSAADTRKRSGSDISGSEKERVPAKRQPAKLAKLVPPPPATSYPQKQYPTPIEHGEQEGHLYHHRQERLAMQQEERDIQDLSMLHKKFVEELGSVQSDEEHYY